MISGTHTIGSPGGTGKKKDQYTFAREQGAFAGFTLTLATKLAHSIQAVPVQSVVSDERAKTRFRLTLPDVQRLAPDVMGWDEDKLNALSVTEQKALLAKIERWQKESRIPITQVEENFELLKERDGWKIFLNWRAGVRVEIRAKLADATPLEVEPVTRDIIFQPGEPFTITLRLRNSSNRELRARVAHNVEPKSLEKYLGVGDCGSFVPFRLGPGKETQSSSTFLVWTDFPAETERFTMLYEFEVDK